MIAEKDEVTEQLRQMIRLNVGQARETNRAEASLCSLSFQSTTHPERHTWLEVDTEGASMDLEDWAIDEWDNVIASIDIESFAEAINILRIWLSGADFAKHYVNGKHEYGPVAAIVS